MNRMSEELRAWWYQVQRDRAARKAWTAEQRAVHKAKKDAARKDKATSKLKAMPMSMAKKLKEKLLAASKLLTQLSGLDPAKLAAALGPALAVAKAATPALAIAGAAGVMGLTGAALLNEREDDTQALKSEVEIVEQQLTERLETVEARPGGVDTTTEVNDLTERVEALERETRVSPLTVAELADRMNMTDEAIESIIATIPGLATDQAVRDVIDRIPVVPEIPEPTPPADLSPIEADIEALRRDVEVNAADVADLQTEVVALAVGVEQLERSVGQLPDSAALSGAVALLQGQIDELPTNDAVNRLETLTDGLTAAQTEAATERDRIEQITAVIQDAVAANATRIGENTDNIDQNGTEITAAAAELAQTRTDLAAATTELARINTEIAAIEPFDPSTIEEFDPADLQAELASANTAIADLLADIAAIEPFDAADLTAADTAIGVRIAQVEAAIAGIPDPSTFDPAALEAAADAATARIAAIEQAIDDLPETGTPVDIAPLEAAVTAIEATLDGLPAPFDPTTLETALTALETAVANLPDPTTPFDPSVLQAELDALETTVANLPTGGETFDPATLEAADAAILLIAEAAQTEADRVALELEATAAGLTAIETAFYADLVSQFAAGRELETVETNGCNGANIFQRPAGDLSATNNTPGTIQEHCYQVRAVAPTLPAACTFPGAGSLALTVEGNMTLTAADGASSGLNSVVQGEFLNGPGYLFIALAPGDTATEESYSGFTFAPKNLVWDADSVTFQIVAFLNYGTAGTGTQPRITTGGPTPTVTLAGSLTCAT